MTFIDGILVVDKPAGMTSAAVVARVKRALGKIKVGHTGTLDPMATGVLPLCLGAATKLAGYLLAEDKTYSGELMLGIETDTLDREGTVLCENADAAAQVTIEGIRSAMGQLQGAGEQIPPMYSAIRQGGVRLHQLARAGKIVERQPRPVRVDRFELLEAELPRVRFEVHCSKGTYVRTLVADLGHRLGCGAHLTELRRTRSGCFDLSHARPLSEIEAHTGALPLVGANQALAHLPQVDVPKAYVGAIQTGKVLFWKDISPAAPEPGVHRLVDPGGHLLALASADQGRLRYARVLPSSLT